jgi:hypothetical protein
MKTTDYYDDRLEKFEYALKKLTSLLTKDSLRGWDMDTNRFIDSLGIFLKEETGIEKTSNGYKLTEPTNLSHSIKELDDLYESITEITLSKKEEKEIYDEAFLVFAMARKIKNNQREKVEKKLHKIFPFYGRVQGIIQSDVSYYSDELDNILKPFGFVSYDVIEKFTDDEWKNYDKEITKTVNDKLKSLEKRYKKSNLTPTLLNFAITPKDPHYYRKLDLYNRRHNITD